MRMHNKNLQSKIQPHPEARCFLSLSLGRGKPPGLPLLWERSGVRLRATIKAISATILLFTSFSSFPQSRYEQAEKAFQNTEYFEAIGLYEKALAKEDVNKGEVNFKIGECYRYGNQYSEALSKYQQSEQAGYDNPLVKYHMGSMLVKLGKYNEAKKKINDFLVILPNDKDGLRLLEACDFALSQKDQPSIYTVQNESSLNSEYSDYGAVYFKDKIIFSSSRIEAGTQVYSYDGQGYSSLYESNYNPKDKSWKKPAKQNELSTQLNDGAITYCTKTNKAYFTQCKMGKGKPAECNILESTFEEKSGKWSSPVPIIAEQKDIAHPSISSDGNTLYFASRSEGGNGGSDLYKMNLQGGKWNSPENLGSMINTAQDELFPVIYQDTILYFSSEGHPGMGGLDIFYSGFSNGSWTKPVNVKPPFNSSADDLYYVLNLSGEEGFFSSNRAGGKGSDDIYYFFLTPITLTVKGKVIDEADKKIIKGAAVELSAGGKEIAIIETDKNGEYFFKLDRKTNYKISVSYPKYFGDSKTLSTVGEMFTKEFSKQNGSDYDFALKRIPREEITIPDIYYDYDKYTLREESKTSLDKLVKLLEDTPEANIQINSHTDERGEYKYNMELSDNRAKSVVDYLIEKGIDPGRLSSKGFGYTQPIVKKAQTEEQHQLNRRTTFNVINQEP